MNLLLLHADELQGREPEQTKTVRLTDHRAAHLRQVLRACPGDTVRIGVLDGPLGEGQVETVDDETVTLQCTFTGPTEPASEDTLLLAVPRPVVLGRCLSLAAALGFGRIALFRSWRVDKSHLSSRVLQATQIEQHLIQGLSQARRTRLPEVRVFPLFRPFVEDELDGLLPPGPRLLAHPAADRELVSVREQVCAIRPVHLAIGPEGGFIPFEIEALEARGFTTVRSGPHPLRVETALAYLAGQLDLLRRL